jgi:hypothetical protein
MAFRDVNGSILTISLNGFKKSTIVDEGVTPVFISEKTGVLVVVVCG